MAQDLRSGVFLDGSFAAHWLPFRREGAIWRFFGGSWACRFAGGLAGRGPGERISLNSTFNNHQSSPGCCRLWSHRAGMPGNRGGCLTGGMQSVCGQIVMGKDARGVDRKKPAACGGRRFAWVGMDGLRESGGRRRGWRGNGLFVFLFLLAGAVSGIDNDSGFFPGLDEAVTGFAAGELEDEVVEIAEVFEQGGGVGLDFLEQGAAVDDLAPGVVDEFLEGGDGGGEDGDAGGGDSATGGSGFSGCGGGEIADGGGSIDEVAASELDDVSLGEIHLAAAVEIAGFLEVDGEGAGGDVSDVFERGLGGGLGIGSATGGGEGLGVLDGDGAEFPGEQDEILAEVGRILSVPGEFVFGALGGGDAGAHHVELVLES